MNYIVFLATSQFKRYPERVNLNQNFNNKNNKQLTRGF